MRKKILYIITKSNWGGAQRYVFDLATNLPKDQFEPVVAFGGTGLAGAAAGILHEKLAAAGIRTIFIPSLTRNVSWSKEFLVWRDLTRLMRTERPDVVHLNSSKAGAWGAFVAFMVGVPCVVFTVHGWPFKEHRNFLATFLIKEISRFTGILSNVVIVVSKEDERLGKNMWGISKKIRYVQLGIKSPDFFSRNDASLLLPDSSNNWPRIVTIAELSVNKGLRFAIEAVAELKKADIDVSYYLIGDGDERERLVTLAQRLQVADRVHFLGFVPDASRLLMAFDVFLLPSLKEGMPYVLLEATAAKLPIISTNVVDSSFLDLINESDRINPGSSGAIARAIEQVLNPNSDKVELIISPLSDMLQKTIELYTTAPTISVSSRA